MNNKKYILDEVLEVQVRDKDGNVVATCNGGDVRSVCLSAGTPPTEIVINGWKVINDDIGNIIAFGVDLEDLSKPTEDN